MSGEVLEVGYASPVSPHLPVEVASYADIVDRMGPVHLAAAQRPGFGVLFFTTSGSGMHSVDFDQVSLTPDRMVFVRPGQLQQWHPRSSIECRVVIARAELCRVSTWTPDEPSEADLDPEAAASASDLMSVLTREQARFGADPSSTRLVTEVFAALTALFDRAASTASPRVELPEAYLAYRSAIEAGLGQSRDARWFIRGLGYSERTVTRACQQVAGVSAKAVLDERLVLEAKRLLAHTDHPVGVVGRSLGFSEASNFNKFFVRHASVLPSQFRQGLRATGWSADLTASQQLSTMY